MSDIVIRGGMVVDGHGGEPFAADVAIDDGKIARIGHHIARGDTEIDARNHIITPGFVDIHTHYDGHVTWAERLNPSAAHGVTTVVTGNCGVGFAPCRPADRSRLVQLMEGVEDIPGVVLEQGVPWTWESFPEYLDFLSTRKFDMDVATQVPHAPLRLYVMGDRALERAPATSDDIAEMARLAEQAVRSGALGFSTSRSLNHRASDGSITYSYAAAEAELIAIACGVSQTGRGVLQFISDFTDVDAEFDLVRSMTAKSGLPLSLSLMQFAHAQARWREILDRIETANDDGLRIRAQTCARPVGILAGLELSFNPFVFCPGFAPLRDLSLADKVQALRNPDMRRRLLQEFPGESWQPIASAVSDLANTFMMSDPPEYEPRRSDSIEAMAQRRGIHPAELAYDLLLEDDGHRIFYLPAANFVDFNAEVMETLLKHELCVPGLGDGGAHCGIVCDSSLTTHLLANWTSRADDRQLPLEHIVKRISHDTARTVGLHDRGTLEAGMRADINVIDPDRLMVALPEVVHDLPGGHSRLHQKATGYAATLVAGQITYRDGMPTGALPGRLVRPSA